MSPERINDVLDALGKIETARDAWHNAATEMRAANQASVSSINMAGLRNEHGEKLADTRARYAREVYALERERLLGLLDAVRDVIDDAPRVARAASP